MKPETQTIGAVVISAIVVAGFTGICFMMMFRTIPDTAVVNQMYGGFQTAFAGVVFYWVGSSAGSRSKDKQIETLVSQAAKTE